MARRKTWREKFETVKEPKLVDDPKGRGKMLIPTPMLVASLVSKVPKGKLITVEQIRRKLAKEFDADLTCPLATGWMIKIVAEAAEEERRVLKKKRITPYWRVIRDDGKLVEKFPGGARRQARLLREEGHRIIKVRNSLKVDDYERFLLKI